MSFERRYQTRATRGTFSRSLRIGRLCLFVLLVFTLLGAQSEDELRVRSILEATDQDWKIFPPEAVVKECTNALRKTPLSQETAAALHERRGNAYLNLDTDEGRTAALQDFEAALRLRPNRPESSWGRAVALFSLKRTQEAKVGCETLVRTAPSYSPSYMLLAAIALQQRENERAVKFAQKAIELTEKESVNFENAVYVRAESHLYRAIALCEQGKLSDGLKDLNRNIELLPLRGPSNHEQSYMLRARILRALGKPDEALVNYQIASHLNPSSLEAKLGMWNAYQELGKLHAAWQIAEQLERTDGGNPKAILACCNSYLAIQEFERASDAARRCLTLLPNDPWCRVLLERASEGLGKYEAALNHFNAVLDADADHAGALVAKSYLLATASDATFRNGKEAIRMARKAAEREPQDHHTMSVLAVAHAEDGDFGSALSALKKCMELVGPNRAASERYRQYQDAFESQRPIRTKANPD